ncbi:MAG: flagellar motor stator protein MotA [Pseudomonadota bacterium]
MIPLISMIAVVIVILASYAGLGGRLIVLYQPLELVIIFGCGVLAFIIGNPWRLVKVSVAKYYRIFRGSKYKKTHYTEILLLQYQIFRLIRQRGVLAMEQHVENPSESPLFTSFPLVTNDENLFGFILDTLRIMSMGIDNAHEMEALLDRDVEKRNYDSKQAVQSMFTLGDSFPALGIVAAVLGVIKTMGAINEPPEVLGNYIAGALVGTFLGVLLCYGWFSPLASAAKLMSEEENSIMNSLRDGFLSHLSGHSPAVSLEFARKSISVSVRPSFDDIEAAIGELPTVGS